MNISVLTVGSESYYCSCVSLLRVTLSEKKNPTKFDVKQTHPPLEAHTLHNYTILLP